MVAAFKFQPAGSMLPKGGFERAMSTKKFVKQFNRDVTPQAERRLDQILRTPAPPRGAEKFVWSLQKSANERARRWWFWAVATGQVPTDGSHYIRSGKIPDSWEISVMLIAGMIEMSLVNRAPGSEYVYGSEAQTQVPGHTTTGWPNLIRVGIQVAEGLEQDLAASWSEFTRKMLPKK